MRYTATLTATMLVVLACGSANAQWKWRDASGRVTASDLPPPNTVPERDILARPADQRRRADASRPALAASTAVGVARPLAATGIDPELEARRKRAVDEQNAAQRQQQASNAAAQGENCKRAQAYLAALSEGTRIGRTNAQGETEIVDDKGRAEEMHRARAVISSDCK